ncbi:MAG: histidine kinase [Bacteroidales bacterium]|nr:histidine kinase [Bacteroidales bacterium]
MSRKIHISIFIQIAVWVLVFLFPLLFIGRESDSMITLPRYLRACILPLSFMILFYVSTLWLIPKYLFKKKYLQFFVIEIVLAVALVAGNYVWHKKMIRPQIEQARAAEAKAAETAAVAQGSAAAGDGVAGAPSAVPAAPVRRGPSPVVFFIRDLTSMAFVIAIACLVMMWSRYLRIEKSLQQAEEQKTKAELDNLKNQINPHFLLNTLNNIYALIAINQDKAQEAVHQLSRLLRHLLYENQDNFIAASKEVEFLKEYVNLMKLRLSPNCKVTFNSTIAEDERIKIAPLLLISLVENAFKHGVSPVKDSFIAIDISQDSSAITCLIQNSYFPKGAEDKSGSGIGLSQVQSRLDLLYKGKYSWEKGVVENNVYRSLLKLYF